MIMSRAPGNYRNTLNVLQQIAAKCGRKTDDVKLLVVSKTIPEAVLQELYDECNIREFAENRVPELSGKVEHLPKDIKWHFIGPMQSNKIRKVVKMAQVIHSVESCEQIEKLDRIAGEENRHPEFFLEVNISGEASKGGLRGDVTREERTTRLSFRRL